MKPEARVRSGEAGKARGAHLAHAAVVGSHVVCCGAPIAFALLATGVGASIGVSAVAEWFASVHAYLHGHEVWILAASALFVLVGGALELRAHNGRRFSALFIVSVLCFTLNAGLIWSHRGGGVFAAAETTRQDAGSLLRPAS